MASCEHCLLVVPDGSAVRDGLPGREVGFCCEGCRSVYRLLHVEGLEDFYRRRIGWVPGPPEACPPDTESLESSVREKDGGHEATLAIAGIRCASCVWLIERYLAGKKGIACARGNFATGRATVRWDPKEISLSDIAGWIRQLGYTPHPVESGRPEEILKAERRDLLLRFGTAAFLTMQVMTFTTGLYAGHFQGIEPKYANAFRWIAFALTTPIIFYAGHPFLKNTLAGLRNRFVGMDALVFLGSFSAYAYSAAVLPGGGEVYFDTAGMIVTLILLGRYLESTARSRASESIARLIRLAPRQAIRRVAGDGLSERTTETVPASLLKYGDVVEIVPGERTPSDGHVIEGESEIDESMLTGEARPVPKRSGSEVFTGTVNGSGRLVVRVTKTGKETVLSRIVQAVEEAQARKAPIQRVADKAVRLFVPAVVAIALLTLGIRLLSGEPPVSALLIAVSVLVVACPCALGLATPLAVFVGCTAARRRGILVKGGDVLEAGASVREVFLDKTGTLTEGRPRLSDTIGFGMEREDVLRLAASLSAPSEHAIAKAIVRGAMRADLVDVTAFRSHPGMGVEGVVGGRRLFLGQEGFLSAMGTPATGAQMEKHRELSSARKTAVFLADGNAVLGLLASEDAPRPEAAEAVGLLEGDGYRVRLVTGDSPEVASRISRETGVGLALSRVTPAGKAGMVREARSPGCGVLMVGDGVNDAPALAEADVGMAMGRGSGIALESADVVLMSDDLRLIHRFLSLSRKTMRVVRQNLAWAFSYNLVAIPLAAAGQLHPIVAAGLMSASSLVVVGNSLRLKNV